MKLVFTQLILALLIFTSCSRISSERNIWSKNIIILVVDGARYSETWGDSSHSYIPHIAKDLAPDGVVFTSFYNNGPTYTTSGHTTITTGVYQEIDNSGNQLPDNPSFFQVYNNTFKKDSTLTWIITSKDKLEVLSDCIAESWKGKYRPMRDCGESGMGSGYRHDSLTYKKVISVLKEYRPELLLVNFREPDYTGHQGVFSDYTKAIVSTDDYVYRIWKFIREDPHYSNSTALFVTNDHGRHLDGFNGGFANHGDTCAGCRHIFLYATGPDFKKGKIENGKIELRDIAKTISYMLKINMPEASGNVIEKIFK
jgi:arylsulfatase A-like enzyme